MRRRIHRTGLLAVQGGYTRRVRAIGLCALTCGVCTTVLACGSAGNPDFALAPVTSSVNLAQGGTAAVQIAVQPVKGSQGSIVLVLSGLPSLPNTNPQLAAVAVAPGQATVGIGSTQTFTLIAAGSAPVGQYTLTATGTSGSVLTSSQITHQANVTLNVTAAATPAP